MDTSKITKFLLDTRYVEASDIKRAEEFVKAKKGTLDEFFVMENIMSRDVLGGLIAQTYNLPYADFNSKQPETEQVLKIPEETALKYRAAFFHETSHAVTIGTDNPEQSGLKEAMSKLFQGKEVIIAYTFPQYLENTFKKYRRPLETRFLKIVEAQTRVAPEIINEIIEDALNNRASDIHFEPLEKEVQIRFRIDGVLTEVGRINKNTYETILNRIKVQSHLRVDEHFSAQDGSMRHHRDDGPVDLRVSILPTIDGEKVVIRVLAEYVASLTLADLGLTPDNQKKILTAAKKPFGMVLVVGPTGSGKSTTLYALLKTFNRSEVNITTIEDPVEYKLIGANQIQVNVNTNLTFAQGLRSILRQDPNVILVGEIRDKETAEIAINAALTGHLLFSTLHANDASTCVPRILDMGAEPFLLASTLQLVIAQRLVRRICKSCKFTYQAPIADVEKKFPIAKRYFKGPKVTLAQGKGCKECGYKGFKGRIAVYEFIETSPALQACILKNPSNLDIWAVARKEGTLSMFEDGINKVIEGETTIDEVLRVATYDSSK